MDSTFTNLESLIKAAGLEFPVLNTGQEKQKPKAKKKFMLVGTHAHQVTGYSKVTYHVIKELAKLDICELFHFGFQKFINESNGYRKYPAGVDVYDPVIKERSKEAESEMGFGFSQLPGYIQAVKPDIIMIYNDAGIICKFLEKMTEKIPEKERTYKLIIYLDQVYTIQRPELLVRIDKDAHIYFAFTQFWKDVLQKQGIIKPIYVLRHGFDPTQFVVKDRSVIRKKHGIPENLFVMLNLNRNTPRKHHDIVVIAFAELVARNPTKPLMLLAVCDGGEGGGYPLKEIYIRELVRLNLNPEHHAHKLSISQSSMSYTDELINELYSLSDIGITAAEGEGFGLCQFEAMGVGVPQVVPRVGGFIDFCINDQNCRSVEPKWRSYLALGQSPVGGIAELVLPFDLSLAAEDYLLDSELRELHGKKARETVLNYTWENEVQSLARVISDI